MYIRNIKTQLLAALTDTPVVLLNGARQTGKSTLARELAESRHPADYVTLDDASTLAAAQYDPAGFIAGQGSSVIIDEIQRAPELFLALKAEVDRDRRPGRFLLTGSANIMLLPHLADSLAGRMEILTLWPLSQGELSGVTEDFVDRLFADDFTLIGLAGQGSEDRVALLRRILRGGYPEVVMRAEEARRGAWFGAYLTTILQRDVRDLANIEGLTALPRLLALLATRVASLFNLADISRGVDIPQTTLKRYLTLLEATYLVTLTPAWSINMGKRLVKAPKLLLNDTGLLGYLLGSDESRLSSEGNLLGGLLENFVAVELRKQIGWSRTRPQMFHFRTQAGQEVDIVLEDRAGRIVGIEVKAGASVSGGDFKGLRALAEAAGARFKRGVVLHAGHAAVPFGENLFALPVSALWSGQGRAGN